MSLLLIVYTLNIVSWPGINLLLRQKYDAAATKDLGKKNSVLTNEIQSYVFLFYMLFH